MTVPDARRAAARLAARSEIQDIRMFSFGAELLSFPPEGSHMVYDLNYETAVALDEDRQAFSITGDYSLLLRLKEKPEGEGDSLAPPVEIAKFNFKLAGLFALSMRADDDPPSEEEFQAYAATTGALALYPFAREFVYDATGRLGIPALTLQVATEPINVTPNAGETE